jgi:hypothetical protein
MRNAVEHPAGWSGYLIFENIRVGSIPGRYIPPTWQRTGRDEGNILNQMECALENLLTLAEDLLVDAVKQNPISKVIEFYEIPVAERDPSCPIRLRISLSPEFLQNLPTG